MMADVRKDGITMRVTMVVEMTGPQVSAYADEYGLPSGGGPLMARHMVDNVRAYVLTSVAESEAFGGPQGVRGATVSLK